MHLQRLAAGALIVALAGCGGGGAKPDASSPKAPDDAAAVIRDWAAAVRTGDYKRADALFALPAELGNGVRIHATRRAEVSVFNRSLPCGAIVTGTKPIAGGRTVATFKLVRGQGGECSGSAQVTFRIRDGHITEWLRESDPDAPPPGSTQV